MLLSADFFQNIKIKSKNYLWNTIRVSNTLDPDQDRHSVGPDLGPNCLPILSLDDNSKKIVKI